MAKPPLLRGAPLHAPTPYLLHAITTLCREKGISESRFGRDAAGDPGLVSGLRAGRELRQSTNDRVLDHMEALRKANPPGKHSHQRLRDAAPAEEHFQRVLHAIGRPQVEALVEAMIDHLDTADAAADPDSADFTRRSDTLPGDPADAEPDNDGMGDQSWSEWHTRGRHKLVETLGGSHEPIKRADGHGIAWEDDEDDDPAEEAGDEHDTDNAEDEQLTGSGLLYADERVGCPITDPGERGGEYESYGQCMSFGIDQTLPISEGEAFHDLNGIALIRVPLPENGR